MEQLVDKKTPVLSSMIAKFVAFLLYLVGAGAACVGGIGVWSMFAYGGFSKEVTDIVRERMVSVAWDQVYSIQDLVRSNDYEVLETELTWSNAFVEIKDEEEVLYSNYTGFETPYFYTFYLHTPVQTKDGEAVKRLTYLLYVNPYFSTHDRYYEIKERVLYIVDNFPIFAVSLAVGMILSLASYVFLMCSAGHRNGKEGIADSVLEPIHTDILIVGVVIVEFILATWMYFDGYNLSVYVADVVIFLLGAVLFGLLSIECAARIKKKRFWNHSLIGWLCRRIGKGIRALVYCVVKVFRKLPVLLNVLLLYGASCVFEFILIYIVDPYSDFFYLWFLKKLILLPGLIYIVLAWNKLKEGGKALSEGDLTYKLDTSKLFLGFKTHGNHLNSIGEGIAIQVEKRLKSEHLKTELITNVSHDIKTPLTSIINYADLIGNLVETEENLGQNGTLTEYSEVLVRQSKRLKKLLEDLVEASKATTGNLEVTLKECEVGVILSQAVGEYEQRFEERHLELIERQPQKAVKILADGKHLWRVFDNLLNNICKYAQEGSRVYLTVEEKERQVRIIFRNMSKFPLELTGEELKERFVRGDKSRHMEGSGLGLSIAGSLMELQNGVMEIVTDGDLFKVVLIFEGIGDK